MLLGYETWSSWKNAKQMQSLLQSRDINRSSECFFELSKVGTATWPVLHLDVSILQRSVRYLDVSTQQGTVLLLDVSTPQGPELHLDGMCINKSKLQGLDELNLDNRSLCFSWTFLHQGQELHLEMSTLQRPVLPWTCLHYAQACITP